MIDLKPLRKAYIKLLEQKYGIKNANERFEVYRTSKDSITLWDKLRNKPMYPIRF